MRSDFATVSHITHLDAGVDEDRKPASLDSGLRRNDEQKAR